MTFEIKKINKFDLCSIGVFMLFTCFLCSTDLPIRFNPHLNNNTIYDNVTNSDDDDLVSTNTHINIHSNINNIISNTSYTVKYYYYLYSTDCEHILKTIYYYKLINLISYTLVALTGLLCIDKIYSFIFSLLLFINIVVGSIIKYNDISTNCYINIAHQYNHEQLLFFMNVFLMWAMGLYCICKCCFDYKNYNKKNNNKNDDKDDDKDDDKQYLLPKYDSINNTSSVINRPSAIIYLSPPNYQESNKSIV